MSESILPKEAGRAPAPERHPRSHPVAMSVSEWTRRPLPLAAHARAYPADRERSILPKERGRPRPRNDLARVHPVAMSVSEWTSPTRRFASERTEPAPSASSQHIVF